MELKHGLICLAVLVLLFLAFSNSLVDRSSAFNLTLNQLSPTPIQTIKIQTPLPPLPSPPVLTISPNQELAAPSRASGDSSSQSAPRNVNNRTITFRAVNNQTTTPTPTQRPVESPKPVPDDSPTETRKSTDGSWLPWIIAGVLFVIVVFLLGRKSKE